MTYTNRQVLLTSRPNGTPSSANIMLQTIDVPDLSAGQVLVRNSLLSLDPTIRGWMSEEKNYMPPINLGEVVRALGAGQVIASRHPAFSEGDWVVGLLDAQYFALRDGDQVSDLAHPQYLLPVDTQAVPLDTYLSTLGLTGGMTAYFGLLHVGQPKPGDTVVVSAAAGSVGSLVGQIAKLKGCRVVGIAGEQAKCDYCVQELGFDACLNYKTDDLRTALQRACPDGIDIYFDNVGGEILDLALEQLRLHARVVVCGAISQYNNKGPMRGPTNYFSLFVNRARMEGTLCTDYSAQFPKAAQEMVGWLTTGHLKPAKTQIEQGLDNFLPSFLKLFTGENFGKLLLDVKH